MLINEPAHVLLFVQEDNIDYGINITDIPVILVKLFNAYVTFWFIYKVLLFTINQIICIYLRNIVANELNWVELSIIITTLMWIIFATRSLYNFERINTYDV